MGGITDSDLGPASTQRVDSCGLLNGNGTHNPLPGSLPSFVKSTTEGEATLGFVTESLWDSLAQAGCKDPCKMHRPLSF
jgi:hypothetical protein